MPTTPLLTGVLAPVVTPFRRDLTPDRDRFLKHCRWLLSQNCGLAVFGTNSEANSLSMDERMGLLDFLVSNGVPPARMMPGTGCCAIPDTVTLTRHAVERGAAGVLMLPPFYYKNVSDEGLYRAFSEVIERVADDRLRIYLYHFPQMSAVPLGIELTRRLLDAYPGIVVGMKDSSGDPANLEAVMREFPGFGLFAGNETLLLKNRRLGGAGCISATANVNPAAIDRLFQRWQSDEAEELQKSLDAVRKAVQQFPLVPALKKILSHYTKDEEWNRLRPPLVELDAPSGKKLVGELDAAGFTVPGLGD